MSKAFFRVLAVLGLFVVGCASGKPAPSCPMPAREAENVIVPEGGDPSFVVRFAQPDFAGWEEARNIAVPEGETVQLRLTRQGVGGRIDFFVVKMPSAASSVAALDDAKKTLVSHGASIAPRVPALPFPERNGVRYAIPGASGTEGIAGAVEIRSFLPTPWAVLAIGAWPASADAARLAEYDRIMTSMRYVPTGPLEAKAALAQCLADKGVKVYSAWWCGPCQWQKKQFGDAVSRLPIVECYPEGGYDEVPECGAAHLKTLPTWQFPDGTRVGESMSLEDIAKRAGCPYAAQ